MKSEIVNGGTYQDTAALMAHELQGPVTVILGCVSMLRDEGLPAEIKKSALDMIEGETRGMGALVQSLMGTLDYGPGDGGRERIDVREVATDAAAGMRGQAELRGATVEALCTGEQVPVMVEANPERIRCVLSNLIRNSLAYSSGPARIFVETRNRPRGDIVEIAVHDYGLGIPRSEHERVFERGRRLTDDVPGSGQGLHLSRMLAEQEGGSLRLEWSEPGKGSVFVLSLPRASARRRLAVGVPVAFRS